MTVFRNLVVFARTSLPLVVAGMTFGTSTFALAQAICNPPCGSGQMCVQGTCMVPVPPPQAYPPAPPPAGYQQAPPSPPPQGYAYPPAPGNPPPAAPGMSAAPPGGAAYPPPAYPQGEAYPPPGYPPPQGGAYPPPGFPPPQGGAYPAPGYPPLPSPTGLAQRRGFLALPFLGINSFQGKTGDNIGVGLRIGVLLGGHINEMLSANGELTIDVVNLNNVPSGTSAGDFVFAFSPLAHLPFGNTEIAVGPKLGLRSQSASFKNTTGETKTRATGYVLGLNAGIFGAVTNSISLGGIFSAEIRSSHESCLTLPGQSEMCSKASADTGDADKVIGLTGAALF